MHDAYLCSVAHGNRHVIKMILETCQLLCGVYHTTSPGVEVPYKLTHKNHPCALWARTSLQHYDWLMHLGFELCREYTHRYGKVHASNAVLLHLRGLPSPNIPSLGFAPPPQAMPEVYYRHPNSSSIEAYRLYYRQEKRHLFAWKRRDVPEFIKFPFADDIHKRRDANETAYAVESEAATAKRKRR